MPLREDSGRKVGRKLAELAALTTQLRAKGHKGTLIDHDGRLFWRATVTTTDGKRGSRRISLGLPANVRQLMAAEDRVISLNVKMAELGYLPDPLPWETAAPTTNEAAEEKQITVAEAVEQLKKDFWQGKVKTAATERTLGRLLAETGRLPQQATLTMDLLVAVGEQQQHGSRTRQEFLKVAKRLAVLVGIEGTDRLDAIRTPYEPAERELPTETQLVALLEAMPKGHQWSWPFWALITYGCRPSEVFSLRPADNGTAKVLTVKQKDKLPIWRTALALPVSDLVCDRELPWDVK